VTRQERTPEGQEPKVRGPRTRRNGEGSIRQRKDGRWEARVFVFTTDGGEVRRSIYGATWEEVHAEMTRLKADSIGGVRLPATGQTVGEFLEYWLVEIAAHRVRPSTLASYRWLSTRYIVPYLGTKKLARVRPSDVRTFLNRLKNVCQCCALGKDAARVARGRSARCCAMRPQRCCSGFLADGSVRYAHRLIRAALQGCGRRRPDPVERREEPPHLAPIPPQVHPVVGGASSPVPTDHQSRSAVRALRRRPGGGTSSRRAAGAALGRRGSGRRRASD
jgi:hypothetical protein